eukprot:SAG31_NODE_35949_length_318_cov_0.698630_1_plen_105_part_11
MIDDVVGRVLMQDAVEHVDLDDMKRLTDAPVAILCTALVTKMFEQLVLVPCKRLVAKTFAQMMGTLSVALLFRMMTRGRLRRLWLVLWIASMAVLSSFGTLTRSP